MHNLLNFSEALALAFHTMGIFAAHPDRLIRAGEIARALNVSENHLQKVNQRLAKAGLIRAVRGPKGGFCLNRRADGISLLEVYEAIEGPLIRNQCILGRPACISPHCILGQLTDGVHGMVSDFFREQTVAGLAHEGFRDLFKAGPSKDAGLGINHTGGELDDSGGRQG